MSLPVLRQVDFGRVAYDPAKGDLLLLRQMLKYGVSVRWKLIDARTQPVCGFVGLIVFAFIALVCGGFTTLHQCDERAQKSGSGADKNPERPKSCP